MSDVEPAFVFHPCMHPPTCKFETTLYFDVVMLTEIIAQTILSEAAGSYVWHFKATKDIQVPAECIK